ncbi:MAG: hypothetical protein Ct9H300mP12_11960 [Acidimicrobiales bacterium]|nr:MAG: hypothetical protein Ct9H300mP12_11960 [Acidimicrobiales bacterium]
MAAGVKAAGFAAMVRVLVVALGTHASDWSPAVAVFGPGVSVVVGASVAVLQTDVRRMLAYSSIAHGGFLLLGVQAAGARGTAAVYAYLVIYTLLATGSFAVLTVMGGPGDSAHSLEDYRGLARRRPGLAGAFTVLLLGQAGVHLPVGSWPSWACWLLPWRAMATGWPGWPCWPQQSPPSSTYEFSSPCTWKTASRTWLAQSPCRWEPVWSSVFRASVCWPSASFRGP